MTDIAGNINLEKPEIIIGGEDITEELVELGILKKKEEIIEIETNSLQDGAEDIQIGDAVSVDGLPIVHVEKCGEIDGPNKYLKLEDGQEFIFRYGNPEGDSITGNWIAWE